VKELELAETRHVEYRDGVIEIVCSEGQTLSEWAIADSVALVARLGPIRGMAIRRDVPDELIGPMEVPIALTPDAWIYIKQLNLKSFSLNCSGNTDLSHLKELSTLEELHLHAIAKPIAPNKLKELQDSLPGCRITVRHSPYR
jgi:hypothetical protein